VLSIGRKPLAWGMMGFGAIAAALAVVPAGASAAPTIEVLEHRNAQSPLYAKLREIAGNRHRRTVHRRHPRPERFHLVVVDGDRHHHGSLLRDRVIRRALNHGKWVLLLDPSSKDSRALLAHAGITNSARSSAYLVRKVHSGPHAGTVRVIHIPQLAARNRRALRRHQVHRAAKILHDAISGTARGAGSGLGSDGSSAPTPPASVDFARYNWTTVKNWMVENKQAVASTVNHTITVFYDAQQIASGARQLIDYRVDTFFDPGTQTYSGKAKKGWWTGSIDHSVAPAPTATWIDSGALNPIPARSAGWNQTPDWTRIAVAPANGNGQETYTSGNDFTVGVSGEGPGASYSWSTSKSYTVDDWGVFTYDFGGGNPAWKFTSRNPCGPGDGKGKCFDPPRPGSIGYGYPSKPSRLSTLPIQVHASAAWATKQIEDETAALDVDGTVTLQKTWCDPNAEADVPLLGGIICLSEKIDRDLASYGIGKQRLIFDLGDSIPTPVESIEFERDQVMAGETVKATLRLARTPTFDTTVSLSTNNDNAAIVPDLKVPAGQREVTFDIATNDNRLNPGQSVTTAITARYRGSVQKQLRITAPQD
jgi:hypothetical protein